MRDIVDQLMREGVQSQSSYTSCITSLTEATYSLQSDDSNTNGIFSEHIVDLPSIKGRKAIYYILSR